MQIIFMCHFSEISSWKETIHIPSSQPVGLTADTRSPLKKRNMLMENFFFKAIIVTH